MVGGLSLDEVSFSDLRSLTVNGLTFNGADRISALRLLDVGILTLSEFAFYGLGNTSIVEIRNVTIEDVPPVMKTDSADIDEVQVFSRLLFNSKFFKNFMLCIPSDRKSVV